jgi:hypothetical protein
VVVIIVTGIGDFVGIGSVCVAAQGRSDFNLQLLWVVISAGVTLAVRLEMSGWVGGVCKRTVAGVHQRLGRTFGGARAHRAPDPCDPPAGF